MTDRPPGWYPNGHGGERWWSGDQWGTNPRPTPRPPRSGAPKRPAVQHRGLVIALVLVAIVLVVVYLAAAVGKSDTAPSGSVTTVTTPTTVLTPTELNDVRSNLLITLDALEHSDLLRDVSENGGWVTVDTALYPKTENIGLANTMCNTVIDKLLALRGSSQMYVVIASSSGRYLSTGTATQPPAPCQGSKQSDG